MSLISNRCLSISLPQCCHKAGDIFKTVSKIVKLFHLANYYRQILPLCHQNTDFCKIEVSYATLTQIGRYGLLGFCSFIRRHLSAFNSQ